MMAKFIICKGAISWKSYVFDAKGQQLLLPSFHSSQGNGTLNLAQIVMAQDTSVVNQKLCQLKMNPIVGM